MSTISIIHMVLLKIIKWLPLIIIISFVSGCSMINNTENSSQEPTNHNTDIWVHDSATRRTSKVAPLFSKTVVFSAKEREQNNTE